MRVEWETAKKQENLADDLDVAGVVDIKPT
jgi:hypothetical protein